MEWQTIIRKDSGVKYFEHYHDSFNGTLVHEIKTDRYGIRYVSCRSCKTRWLFCKEIKEDMPI